MGKKVYTVDNKQFLVDDETGEIKKVIIGNDVSEEERKEFICFLLKEIERLEK